MGKVGIAKIARTPQPASSVVFTLCLVALIALLAWPGSAAAAVGDEQLCTAAKTKASGRYARCRMFAEARHARSPDDVRLAERIEKCAAKLVRAFSNAESRYGTACRTAPDGTRVENYLAAVSNHLADHFAFESDLMEPATCGPPGVVDPATGECLARWVVSDHQAPPEGYVRRGGAAYWSDIAAFEEPRRDFGAATTSDGVFVVGGQSRDGNTYLNTLEQLTESGWVPRPSMPTSRTLPATATVDDRSFLAIGGVGEYGVVATVERYDTQDHLWTTETPMLTPRAGSSAVTIGNMVYAIGGFDETGWLRVVEQYDVDTGIWTRRSPLPPSFPGSPFGAIAAAAVDGRIYAFGYGLIHVYDPGSDSWTTSQTEGLYTTEIKAAASNGKIYLFGGVLVGCDGFSAVYDPVTETWAGTAPDWNRPCPDSTAALDGKLYVLGSGRSPLTRSRRYNPEGYLHTIGP